MNEKQTYALVNKETKKIIKHNGRLQYFRLKQAAFHKRNKLQTELGIKIEINPLKPSLQGRWKPEKNEKIQKIQI